MESILIWLVTIAIFIAIFIPYFLKFRRKLKADLKRKQEAESIGIGRPRSQFPMVDNTACIGCGSCVDACPEGDVLGVIFGKAAIINGDRCVGHGYCELVCPVGALKVGLGDITTRDDIPILDENYQTNIPGLFVVGELGGISLIRNAIAQGQKAVKRISEIHTCKSSGSNYDLVIVGGGPAGLSSALSAGLSKLKYIVLDQQDPGGTILQYPRRKLVMTQPVEIPSYGTLDKPEYSKEELLDMWHGVINKHEIQFRPDSKVDKLISTKNRFEIYSGENMITADYVILAMGRRGSPRKLGVPGEDLPKVAYQLVDAQSYNKNDILVVGGGDSAIEAAIGLARQNDNRVTISYRKSQFFRIKKKNEERFNELTGKGNIKPIFESNVSRIDTDSVTLKTVNGEIKIANDYIFIFAGGIPPFKMLKEIGIKFGGDMEPL